MHRKLKTSLILILFLLIGCKGKIIYTYNNINYESKESAISAQKVELDTMLSRIDPIIKPVGGSAIVILPSISYIKKNFISMKGRPPNKETEEKLISYTALIIYNEWCARGEAIKKRRIFDRLIITESDEPENVIFSEDFAIICLKKNDNAQWFLKKKKVISSAMVPIEEVSIALPRVQRMILWLDNVEKLARNE